MNFLFNKKLNLKKVNGNTEPDRYVSEITTITSMFLIQIEAIIPKPSTLKYSATYV